jgi:hypothetical protein
MPPAHTTAPILHAWAVMLNLIAAPGTGLAQSIDSPEKVWADFDPRREPLEIETLKQWSEGGTRYHELFFHGETYQGQPVRVYAIYAAP